MQQRQPRLGDILDDYCPRERRITNHAIVAMINDQIKQTRCTTCDAEHEYKQAKIPPQRKKKDALSAAYKQGPAGATKGGTAPTTDEVVAAARSDNGGDQPSAPTLSPGSIETPEGNGPPGPAPGGPAADEEGPVHRPLIRATLPRPEGQPPGRPAPEFTLRQPGGRPGRFRPAGGRGPHRPARPPGHSQQPQGGGRHGAPGRQGMRSDPLGNRGGRPHQPHRPSRHSGPPSRAGKKRSK